jgi:hypothetical protein
VPLAQPGADLLGGVRPALPPTAGQHRPGRRDAGETGQAQQLRHPHGPDGSAVPELSLDAAVDLTRTGDVWVVRGASVADRAIRTLPDAPVDHVGMAVVLEDLPPLLRHAELGRSLPDVWTGRHQRGVQLHDLAAAVRTWRQRYGQRARLRRGTSTETVYCAELVATTCTAMGLLDGRRPRNAYDPGSFWSGDDLRLLQGATLGPEIPVAVPAAQPSRRTR